MLDLNGLIEDTIKMLRHLIGEDVELVFRPDKTMGVVNADVAQIEQVLLNMAVNARDAMPRGGTLTIETRAVALGKGKDKRRDHVALIVSDTGDGMDAETLGHVFEPFFTTKPAGKGTGLGLATVYGIVAQHHGTIEVTSEPGVGTTFHILLPCADAAVAETAEEYGESPATGSETILLVEDEEHVRNITRRVLEELGYTVLTASGAGEGDDIFAEHADGIALLLTDVVMPGRSGVDMAQGMLARKPSLKILYMSGYPDTTVMNRVAIDEGVFIQKPFTPAELARKIREALEKTRKRKPKKR